MTAGTVSAIILAHNRAGLIRQVLTEVGTSGVDEIVVVDSGSSDGTADVVRGVAEDLPVPLLLLEPQANVALAGRNLAAEAASGEYLLMLDDDSFPDSGAVARLTGVLDTHGEVAAVGGFVADVDADGRTVRSTELGTFDWFLRGGRSGSVPDRGMDAFFFPECACLIRRSVFRQVGGFREAFFFTVSEIDLATRIIAAGWEVTYQPAAGFTHLKAQAGRMSHRRTLTLRIRNQLWYFWLHFPVRAAIPRMAAYLLFDLIECVARGVPAAWIDGVRRAIVEAGAVRAERRVLPGPVRRRAELNRGRLHLALLRGQLLRRLGA